MAAFSPVEKAFLSLAFIPCAVLLFIIYRYAKHRLVGQSDTIERRMEKWYAAMSGIMLGIFVFRTLPQAASCLSGSAGWSYRALAAFVMVGFSALMWIDKLGRVWSFTANYAGLTAEETSDTVQTHIIDALNMEVTDYYESTDMSGDAFPRDLHKLHVESQLLIRRRRNAILLYTLMVFVCIVEGLYLVYRQNVALGGPAGMVACFYFDKLAESLVVGTMLVHGMFHALVSPHHRWFWVLCGGYCLVIVLSTVPVLSDTPVAEIATAVQHPALAVFYALAAGVIFYISIYFIFTNRIATDRRDMLLRLFAFAGGLWLPFVTGFFL